MDGLIELLGKLSPLLILIVPLLFSRRKTALDNLASEVGSRKTAAETESQELRNFSDFRTQLTALDGVVAQMRGQLNQASDTVEKQAGEIKELNKAALRHDNALDEANKATVAYKDKWEFAVIEISGCRAVAEQATQDLQDAFRRIVLLETELRRLGGLSEKEENGKRIEQVIEDAKAQTEETTPPPVPDTPTE